MAQSSGQPHPVKLRVGNADTDQRKSFVKLFHGAFDAMLCNSRPGDSAELHMSDGSIVHLQIHAVHDRGDALEIDIAPGKQTKSGHPQGLTSG